MDSIASAAGFIHSETDVKHRAISVCVRYPGPRLQRMSLVSGVSVRIVLQIRLPWRYEMCGPARYNHKAVGAQMSDCREAAGTQ